MTSPFRRVTEIFWASPQIDLADLAEAKARGFTLVVNNRPDSEAPDQPAGAEIEQAAQRIGLEYRAIPITHAGFSEAQVEAMVATLSEAKGPVLAYCRSGTRSTLLWALAQARLGCDLDVISEDAAAAGYDVASIRPLMDMLAQRTAG